MAITGGTWKKHARYIGTIIADGEHPDPRINSAEHRALYGGALVAELIFNPDDLALFLAAPKMLEALRGMLALQDMLWKSVPWGKTFNLDAKLLNEAPIAARAAIDLAEGKG